MNRLLIAMLVLAAAGCESTGADDDPLDAGPDTDAGPEPDTDSSTWSEQVDEFWGEAPDTATRLEMFDTLWGRFDELYACFDSWDVDWQATRDRYRPRVEAAAGFGTFYGALRAMIDELHDAHSPLLSETVCRTPRYQRPPMYKNLSIIPIVGGCVTLDDEDQLIVYRTAADADNPLALVPGDVIVGFDGLDWPDNLADVESWGLPECDEDYAGAPISAARMRAVSLPANGHLFSTIEIRRWGSDQIESFDTELILPNISDYIVCSDQIPTAGIAQPFDDWAVFDSAGCSNCLSAGVIPDTNIGYISVYAWYNDALDDFAAAVSDLWNTDGLIIDQRFNLGGVIPFVDYGFGMLLAEDIDPLVEFHKRDPDSDDERALVLDFPLAVDADETTYYDHPIAVLTGPRSGSAGDLAPYLLAHHPRARLFGRATNGAFGELTYVWYPVDPFIQDMSAKLTRAQMLAADGTHLNAWEQQPDVEVWITREDAAAGIDTVFETALAWVLEENGL